MDEGPKVMVKLSAATKTKTNLDSTFSFSKCLCQDWSRCIVALLTNDLATGWVPVTGFAYLKRMIFLSCVIYMHYYDHNVSQHYLITKGDLAKDELHP